MDNALLHDAIVWAALGIGLACIVARLIFPQRPGPERATGEVPGDVSGAGD